MASGNVSPRPASAAPPSSAPPDLEGTLKKVGKTKGLIGNPWKTRLFKQQREKLFYYKPGAKAPKVLVISWFTFVGRDKNLKISPPLDTLEERAVYHYFLGHIELSRVTSVTKSANGGPWGITLITPGREWQLQAESEQAQRYWVEGLTRWLETAPAPPRSPREGASPSPSASPRPASPQRGPRATSPQKGSAQEKETRSVSPAPKPASVSPSKARSVSPQKGQGDIPPPSQELKALLARLHEKVASSQRYLVDEQSAIWVQNLDIVEDTMREVKELLSQQAKLLGGHPDGRKAQEQYAGWLSQTQDLLVKKRTRAELTQIKTAVTVRQNQAAVALEHGRRSEVEEHLAAVRQLLIDSALLHASDEVRAYQGSVNAWLQETTAKLAASKPVIEEAAAAPAQEGAEDRDRTGTEAQIRDLAKEQQRLREQRERTTKQLQTLELEEGAGGPKKDNTPDAQEDWGS